MMSSIRLGAEWLVANSQRVCSKVLAPRILEMEEEEASEAHAKLKLRDRQLTADEDEDVRAPFCFIFQAMSDMQLFLEEVRDRGVRVSALFDPSI